ncbi:MAG: prepilin-type N-terminal cleavage/methylation domain-containing protein [Planctomycetota bacterium]
MIGRHEGFSLLEMLLALAVLGSSLGILAQIAGTGSDAAREARELSQARMIAQAKLAEILIQGISPQAVPPSPAEPVDSSSSTPFQYQVDVAPAALDGMLAIRIQVEALDPDGGPSLARYAVTRWMIDPLLGLADLAAEEAAMREEQLAEAP